jgi:diaminopimelate decarboxylase
MDHFTYRQGRLYCEDVELDALAARTGTPVYVYSRRTLVEHFRTFSAAFAALAPLVCFSVKSAGNVHLLRALVEAGAGLDVVSGGELYRALLAGCAPGRVVAAGVAKTEAELRYALAARVGCLNVESEEEFALLARLAREAGVPARAALRVNPDVALDARTHAKTTTGQRGSKFGVDLDRAEAFFEAWGRDERVTLDGLHVHLGSPIYGPGPYVEAARKLLALAARLEGRGFPVRALDLGGGFAADYDVEAPRWPAYAGPLAEVLGPFVARGGQVVLEPGRSISANAGVLVTAVQYTKPAGGRTVVLVDAGMNALIRAPMYDAYHFIWPTRTRPDQHPRGRAPAQPAPGLAPCDVAGPICESGDYFARGRALPRVRRGDLLAVFGAGAYGMVMASQYNAHPRPAEVLVDGGAATLIRQRETYEDLVAPERVARPV